MMLLLFLVTVRKDFAQSFIPLVTYYKALGDTGLINNVKLY